MKITRHHAHGLVTATARPSTLRERIGLWLHGWEPARDGRWICPHYGITQRLEPRAPFNVTCARCRGTIYGTIHCCDPDCPLRDDCGVVSAFDQPTRRPSI